MIGCRSRRSNHQRPRPAVDRNPTRKLSSGSRSDGVAKHVSGVPPVEGTACINGFRATCLHGCGGKGAGSGLRQWTDVRDVRYIIVPVAVRRACATPLTDVVHDEDVLIGDYPSTPVDGLIDTDRQQLVLTGVLVGTPRGPVTGHQDLEGFGDPTGKYTGRFATIIRNAWQERLVVLAAVVEFHRLQDAGTGFVAQFGGGTPGAVESCHLNDAYRHIGVSLLEESRKNQVSLQTGVHPVGVRVGRTRAYL